MKNWLEIKKQLLMRELFNSREKLDEINTAKDFFEKHIASLKSNLELLEEVLKQIPEPVNDKKEEDKKEGGVPTLNS